MSHWTRVLSRDLLSVVRRGSPSPDQHVCRTATGRKTLQMAFYAAGCHVGFRTSSFQLHVSRTFLDCLQSVSEFISIIACLVVSAAFRVMLSIFNCNGATWPAGLNEYNAMRAAKAAKDVQAASAELVDRLCHFFGEEVTGLPAKFDSQLPSDSLDWYMEYLNTQALPILHRVLRLLCCEQPDNPSGAILLSMAKRLCDATLLAELHSVLGVEFQAGRSWGAAVGNGFLAEVEDAEVADSPVIPVPPPQPKPQDKGIPGEGRASPSGFRRVGPGTCRGCGFLVVPAKALTPNVLSTCMPKTNTNSTSTGPDASCIPSHLLCNSGLRCMFAVCYIFDVQSLLASIAVSDGL
ncbi:unnamed protein product [Symbiodinium sp. CCMP2592]|nr:unnamed protein product [Symbiodinium sp. CCMP2592]